jgi:hypothetical protein
MDNVKTKELKAAFDEFWQKEGCDLAIKEIITVSFLNPFAFEDWLVEKAPY